MIACLLEALDATHSTGIIHRDIKPENLVFDDKGYLHLTDYGIARHWEPENYQENSGTPGYMAPEVMFK
jgi:serine/threonine protein kinase